ncbi:MAG TPA: LysE family translocator [Usitatibacteraceae bacterium]|nr:LysE family translocator [Usitatibacteraceae bacterium]
MIHDLPLFILAGIVLNFTPGPDMAYFGSRAASQGFKGGVAAFMGVCAGCLLHTLAAALGLSAILLTSAEAFFVVKLVGAGYLLWVGIGMLRESRRAALAIDSSLAAVPYGKLFMQGFLTNALNPKIALFFLAFLPQFIEPGSPDRAPAFVLLGLVFILNSMVTMIPLIWMFARLGARMRAGSRLVDWLNRACGALFVGVGIRLALTERPA